jgi:hypothetical protein
MANVCLVIHLDGSRLLWKEVFEPRLPYKNPKKGPPLGFGNEYFLA